MPVTAPSAPARSPIVERLVGETGEPQRVSGAARALATRVIPRILADIEELVSFPLEMEVDGVDVVRFGEAKPKRAQFEAMSIVPSKSSPDALAILAGADLVGLLVGAVFGGDPDVPAEPITRKPSPIELQLVGSLFNSIAKAFNGSGERALDLRFPINAPVSGADLDKLVLRDGPGVKITFRLSSSAGFGTLSVTMPQRVLLSQRGDATQAAAPEIATPGAWKARFGEEVMRSSVALEATIPLSKMTLTELTQLRVGQVIEFPQDAQANTRLSARRKTVFVCEFGKLGNHFTVRVRHPYDAGKEFMDGLISG
ncbi:FliM/FliN family flagellar motor switch protein [Aliihoeflea sp. 40Bstr573]|uniref:FliM/FliN family flagellar motor switch protein n=1 Tax=Aliihoeflea sp. 40Bstr573 TaxID=2696467 RepID=UPI0020950968|nr:FliM/FliN family flagellar motor switch protein [Aliihoeflea sp. 40Bstr573]MCO6386617.1 flagellar motor switch protein FliM [Aliihoeflea sp. 40Bstr573]